MTSAMLLSIPSLRSISLFIFAMFLQCDRFSLASGSLPLRSSMRLIHRNTRPSDQLVT
eukprot:CAMPEP_0113911624 /NCGR_PEP_ID=MMETSP0780_2-20120614/28348_1 /TAXON_ID=652834 /ORGANISM="Palpitomonas bilix" /LENGTH=57 /DNA_ID=CAMNT_0000908239 /DNA_START=271 /DNA_END=440 /DNA_ORIENTATION=- /assembly_acc=CAM_ASM_000599